MYVSEAPEADSGGPGGGSGGPRAGSDVGPQGPSATTGFATPGFCRPETILKHLKTTQIHPPKPTRFSKIIPAPAHAP